MIDEREIVRRAVEQLAPPEPSLERLTRRRDRKQRNHRILAGVVALVAVVAVAGALGRALSPQPVPLDDPRTRFVGEWVATDPDGSAESMTVRTSGATALAIVVHHDAASSCAGGPSEITGTGRLQGSSELVVASPVLTCSDGSDPQAPSGPSVQVLTFAFHASTLTLTDNVGVVWERPGQNPSPGPPATDLGIFAGVRGWIAYGDSQQSASAIKAMDPANPETEPVVLDPDGGVPIAWSSDGSKLLILRGRSQLLVLNADGTETIVADSGLSGYPGGSFTPDGSRVVYLSDHGIVSVDLDGGSPQLLYTAEGLYQSALAPDGSRLAWIQGHGDDLNSLWVMNIDGSERRRLLGDADAGRTPWTLQWSPDGTRLALSRGGADRSLLVVNADGSGSPLRGPNVSELVLGAGPYWSPDGTLLAFATGYWKSPTLAIAHPDGTGLRELTVGRPGPWNPLHPTPTAAPTATATPPDGPTTTGPTPFRGEGAFIVFARNIAGGWDLAARDPLTGSVTTIVGTDGLVDCAEGAPCTNFIRKAEWSPDGRWMVFQVSNESLDGPSLGPCGPTVGLWVLGGNGVLRQLTTPCEAPLPGSDEPVQELWEWSPVGARLAYARIDGATDELFVIDPTDGRRTSLVTGNIDPPYPPVGASSLAWSPDGSRIAYVDGSSVSAVDVKGGEPSVLADSFEDIIHIAWSPDGTRILVHDQGRYRIQVMNADGSDLHVVLEGEDACCATAWSPNGDRILYLLSGVRPEEPATGKVSEVWTVAPDGSNPIELFGRDSCSAANIDGSPAWSPNGTQVAYDAPRCGGWVVENADGTGDREPIDELVWRSWSSDGLTESDLAGIGQRDH